MHYIAECTAQYKQAGGYTTTPADGELEVDELRRKLAEANEQKASLSAQLDEVSILPGRTKGGHSKIFRTIVSNVLSCEYA
jgi:hypothetical protein